MQYPSAIRFGIFCAIAVVFPGPVLAENEYPAAYFEPYIIYQAPEIAEKAAAATGSSTAETAPAEAASEPAAENPYPAAYFEPVIVYQDKDLISAQEKQSAAEPEPAPVPKSEASGKKNNPGPAEAAPVPASEKGGVPVGMLLLIAGIAGGLYWVISKNKGDSPAVETASAEVDLPGNDEGLAGDAGESGSQAPEQPEAS
jgi:hypothetical protein